MFLAQPVERRAMVPLIEPVEAVVAAAEVPKVRRRRKAEAGAGEAAAETVQPEPRPRRKRSRQDTTISAD
jgi:hypothetical protein